MRRNGFGKFDWSTTIRSLRMRKKVFVISSDQLSNAIAFVIQVRYCSIDCATGYQLSWNRLSWIKSKTLREFFILFCSRQAKKSYSINAINLNHSTKNKQNLQRLIIFKWLWKKYISTLKNNLLSGIKEKSIPLCHRTSRRDREIRCRVRGGKVCPDPWARCWDFWAAPIHLCI